MFRLTIALLFICSVCFAQTNTDSLQSIVDKAQNDTVKVNALIALSSAYMRSQPERAIKYADRAREVADRSGFQKGLAFSLKNIGLAYYLQGKYVEALDYWQQSLKIFMAIENQLGIGNMLNNIGAVYFSQGNDANALDYYLQSLQVSEKIGDKLRIATALTNIGAVYFNNPLTHDKALEYYLKALPISEASGDQAAIGTSSVNIGEIYFAKGDNKSALLYFEKAQKALETAGNLNTVAYTLNDIGKVYAASGDFERATQFQLKAVDLANKVNAKLEMTQSLLGLANTYKSQGKTANSLQSYQKVESLAKEIGADYELKSAYEGLADTYTLLSDFKNAFKYQRLLTTIKDTLYNTENNKKIQGLQFNFDIQKKQTEIDLLTKDKALQNLDLQRQKFVKNSLFAGLLLIMSIAFILFHSNRQKIKANKLLQQQNDEINLQKEEIATQRDKLDSQKDEIERLLLNILPEETAQELKQNGSATPRYYETVSVLFTDFVDFTKIAEVFSPQELLAELNEHFVAFDTIIEKYHLEKIKTIGDSYMCAAGVPSEDRNSAENIVRAGLEIEKYMEAVNQEKIEHSAKPWNIRIGIHSGPVVAGVVGKKKFAYDIWGDTVNLASRMESNGQTGRVNISSATHDLLNGKFVCHYRGKIMAKNKGEIDMYFVEKEIA